MEINFLHQLLVAVGVMLATQGVKKVKGIPVNQGQTARVRTVAGILSFVATLGVAFADGNIESVLSPDLIQVGVGAAASWLLAHFGYKAVK